MKKNLVYILLLACLFTACKDDDPILSPFDQVTRAVIDGKAAQMSTAAIEVESPGTDLEPGAIIIYLTDAGLYGKFKVVSTGGDSGPIVFDRINYNANGTVKSDVKNITITTSKYCDLDADVQTDDVAAADFQFTYDPISGTKIVPRVDAKFFLYSN